MPKELDSNTPGGFLRSIRENAGLTQDQVAASMGVTKSAISKTEMLLTNPSNRMLSGYAAILGIQVEELAIPYIEKKEKFIGINPIAKEALNRLEQVGKAFQRAGDGARGEVMGMMRNGEFTPDNIGLVISKQSEAAVYDRVSDITREALEKVRQELRTISERGASQQQNTPAQDNAFN